MQLALNNPYDQLHPSVSRNIGRVNLFSCIIHVRRQLGAKRTVTLHIFADASTTIFGLSEYQTARPPQLRQSSFPRSCPGEASVKSVTHSVSCGSGSLQPQARLPAEIHTALNSFKLSDGLCSSNQSKYSSCPPCALCTTLLDVRPGGTRNTGSLPIYKIAGWPYAQAHAGRRDLPEIPNPARSGSPSTTYARSRYFHGIHGIPCVSR